MLESNLANDNYAYAIDHPYMRTLYAPFKIDMSRFGIDDKYFGDAFGSSSGNTMSAQITIQFASGVPLFLEVLSNVLPLSDLVCRLYTETQVEAACENGLYKSIA